MLLTLYSALLPWPAMLATCCICFSRHDAADAMLDAAMLIYLLIRHATPRRHDDTPLHVTLLMLFDFVYAMPLPYDMPLYAMLLMLMPRDAATLRH